MQRRYLKIIASIIFAILPLVSIFSQILTAPEDKLLLKALQENGSKDFACSINDIKAIGLISYVDNIYKIEGCNKYGNYKCHKLETFSPTYECKINGDIGDKSVDAKKITDAENLKQAELLAFKKRLTSKSTFGKFGGGYQEAKWGMSHTEVSSLYEKNGEIKFDKDKAVLNVKSEKVEINFYFYKESLYRVEVNTGNSDNVLVLVNKFGKAASYETFMDESMNQNGDHFKWQRFEYVWSDGNTKIYAQECQDKNEAASNLSSIFKKVCSWNNKFDRAVVFLSTVIESAIKQDQDEAAKASAIEKNRGNF